MQFDSQIYWNFFLSPAKEKWRRFRIFLLFQLLKENWPTRRLALSVKSAGIEEKKVRAMVRRWVREEREKGHGSSDDDLTDERLERRETILDAGLFTVHFSSLQSIWVVGLPSISPMLLQAIAQLEFELVVMMSRLRRLENF